jgi:hypothetical protein
MSRFIDNTQFLGSILSRMGISSYKPHYLFHTSISYIVSCHSGVFFLLIDFCLRRKATQRIEDSRYSYGNGMLFYSASPVFSNGGGCQGSVRALTYYCIICVRNIQAAYPKCRSKMMKKMVS